MNINDLPIIMIKCLLCTIIIELVLSLILGIRTKKDILNIILVNIATNPIVVSVPILFLIKYNSNMRIISLYILEIFTVLVEGFIYKKVLNYKKINPYLFSLLLNCGSYFIGKLL